MARRLPAQFTMQRPAKPSSHSSAALKKVAEFKVDEVVRRDKQSWQRDAYALNSAIGQVSKTNSITANTVAACDLAPTYIDPETGIERRLDDILDADEGDDGFDPELREVAEAVRRVDEAFIGPLGGKRQLMWRAAWHLRVGGESFLVGTPSKDPRITPAGDSPELLWEFLSPLEYRQQDDKKWVRDSTGRSSQVSPMGASTGNGDTFAAMLGPRGQMADEGYSARLWQQDPAFGELPYCAMKTALADMTQYVELRGVIDAAIQTRMSAGMLLVDESLSFGPDNEPDEGSEEDELDPFTLELVTHMAAPIADRTSGASLVPLVLRGKGELLKEVRLIDLSNDNRALEELRTTREETLKSVMQILDAPAELVGGKAELNHWTGFAVDEELTGRYVIPLGQAIAGFTTQAYLQAMLVEFEDFTEEEAARWFYEFDPSNITAKADRGVTFIRLWDRGLVSDSAARSANGATEADAPPLEERRERFIIELVTASPKFLPMLRLTELFADVDLSELEAIAALIPEIGPGGAPGPPAAPQPGAPPPTGDQNPGEPTGDPTTGDGRPDTQPGLESGDVPIESSRDARLIGMLLGEADAAVERALERAGARLVSRFDKSDEADPVRARLRGRRKTEALALCSNGDLAGVGLTPEDLLSGEWDDFQVKAEGLVRPWVENTIGRNGHIAAEQARCVSEQMAEALMVLTLNDRGAQRYGTEGLRVPTETVVTPLETVGKVRW